MQTQMQSPLGRREHPIIDPQRVRLAARVLGIHDDVRHIAGLDVTDIRAAFVRTKKRVRVRGKNEIFHLEMFRDTLETFVLYYQRRARTARTM